MKTLKTSWVARIAVWAGIAVAGSISASAAPTACAGSTLAVLAAAGANTPANGCGAVDLGFNGFVDSGGSLNLTNVTLSSLTGGTISGSGASQAITNLVAQFNSTGWNTSSGTSLTTYSVIDSRLQVLPGESAPTAPFSTWGITSLGLGLQENTGAPANAGNYVEVRTEFCLGLTGFTCIAANSNYGYVQQRLTFTSGSTAVTILNTICTPGAGGCTTSTNALATANISFGSTGFLSLGTRNTVTVNRISGAGGGFAIDLDSFQLSMGQTAVTPEPSTFGMLGSALLGLGFWARKRRKS